MPVSNDFRDFVLEQLATAKDSWLQRDLPGDVRVANKHGTLDAVRSDCGIVYAPNRPFAIAVMTSLVRDERGAEAAIAAVALEAYRFFEMLGKASEYGRALPPPK
jgi:beta-lactamase class A